MSAMAKDEAIGIVALRKESVDRNHRVPGPCVQIAKSLSARRAWIEIAGTCPVFTLSDRRSPQGERG